MFLFGVDYYPEHWPEERWALDVRLMVEAGFNVVRLGEFAWTKIEPCQGRFDFSWLDRAIQLFQERGMRVILGTPTASPPAWLMQPNPELFRVREDGHRLTYGNRREYCPNHPLYHAHTREIVRAMAEHFAQNPAVIGWQIDNEFGDRCYCPVCRAGFQKWLQRRYSTLDELNQRWGTIFWSHLYSDWDEIPVPLSTGNSPNPSLALDFYRFCSNSYVEYQKIQIDLIRQICPGTIITHNFMGFKYEFVNYFDLAADLDVVSYDCYPRMQWTMQAEVDPGWQALAYDTMRGLKGKNYWMMEQQAGQGGWEQLSVMPRPGELRLWAYQAIAHGADAIVFFRWRTSRFGTEQYWFGLLDHHGTPGRRYAEIKRMGKEIASAGMSLLSTTLKAETAFLLSYDVRFAFQIQPNNPQFSYPAHFYHLYQAFHRRNIPVDVIGPDADFSSYKLIVAPSLYLLSEHLVDRLNQFVRDGGVLVLTQRSGVKDETNLVIDEPLPGRLGEACGAEVVETDSLAPGMTNSIVFEPTHWREVPPFEVGVICDILKPISACAIASYTQEYYAAQPAITLNHYGKGQAIYIGTIGTAALYDEVTSWLQQRLRLESILDQSSNIEICRRQGESGEFLFLLNHTNQPQPVNLEFDYTKTLDDQRLPAGLHSLPPKEVWVLIRE